MALSTLVCYPKWALTGFRRLRIPKRLKNVQCGH